MRRCKNHTSDVILSCVVASYTCVRNDIVDQGFEDGSSSGSLRPLFLHIECVAERKRCFVNSFREFPCVEKKLHVRSGNEHVALLAIFPKCDKMSSYSLPQLSHRVACSKVSSEPRDIARVKTFARSKLPTTSFFTCRVRDLSMRLRWPVSAGQLGTRALFSLVDKHVVRPRALV